MGERLFGLDAQTIFGACILAINMLIMFTVLSYLLFNPVRTLIKKRKEKIESDREKAAGDMKSAEDLKQMYEEKLKNADKEAEAILSDARKRALNSEENIVNQAKAEAKDIIAKAKREAELEKSKACDEVKTEIIKVASCMAEKIVKVSMDNDMQNKLIDETLKEMGDSTWLS